MEADDTTCSPGRSRSVGACRGATLTPAERPRRAPDQLRSARVSRARGRRQRARVASHPARVVEYYLRSRTHLSLDKDAPVLRPAASATGGEIVTIPHMGGLHHCYDRPRCVDLALPSFRTFEDRTPPNVGQRRRVNSRPVQSNRGFRSSRSSRFRRRRTIRRVRMRRRRAPTTFFVGTDSQR